PTDRPRPAKQRYDGEVVYMYLDEALSAQIHTLSRDADSTLFVTLLSAYYVLLSRYTAQDDISVGTSVDMRTHPQLENTIGYFLNTVVLRENIKPELSFSSLLTEVRDTTLSAFANQDVEFEQVVEKLGVGRNSGFNPLFQTMFVMWNETSYAPQIPTFSMTPQQVHPSASKFDISFYAQPERDGRILVAIEYATHLFDKATIKRMQGHYETILRSVVAEPETAIKDIRLLTHAENQLLLETWTDTAQDYPREKLVHDLIAENPADAIAVWDESGQLSYGELNARANQIAHHLVTLGITAGTPIGICLERSHEMLIGIVAILKAGGAYVPIDPSYPQERIETIVEDAGISIILTQSHLETTLADRAQHTITINDKEAFADYPTTLPDTEATPDTLAYIIYTSGSTGKPKGVRITHRNLVHSTTARESVYPLQVERFLLLSSFAFDSSLVGIFWTLCGGGTLCLPPQDAEKDVTQIAELIAQYGITHLLALPSLYQILLEFADDNQLASLNTVMVAGEACPIALVRAHYELLQNATLWNEYGPTEGTVWSSVWEVPADADKMLIGKAIPNMQTYILDSQQVPVPVGVYGELYIGGEGIAQDYHERPDLTAERFIGNPFGTGRLYRTGDIARYLTDGNIEFAGRDDNQVKISGYRIELGEVENAFSRLDAVQHVVVVVREIAGQKRLVAFVSTTETATSDDIRQQVRPTLPAYMIPTHIEILDALPRNPNGKLDRKALETYPIARADNAPVSAKATNDVEKQLLTIWQELLGATVPSVDADFFELGGYSLLAIRMFARIKQAFDVELPISLIMESPTIRGLAETIAQDGIGEKTLFTLVVEGDKPPLYCLQVNKFGLIHYQTLAQQLNANRPVIGLGLPDALDTAETTIEEVAEHNARTILAHQTEAPFYIAGLSVAGLVAYETARKLKSDGHEVYVILFDTQGPDYPTRIAPMDAIRKRAGIMWHQLTTWDGTARDELIGYWRWLLAYRLGYQVQKRSNWVRAKLGLPVVTSDDQEFRNAIDSDAIQAQIDAYFAGNRADDIPILLYRSHLQPITSEPEWALGWDKFVPENHIDVHHVGAPHTDLLKSQYINQIVTHLRDWLTEKDSSHKQK
ncbi:MAG: amino acid adenylation domain-containing protein, partial [Chloroflexota bacterium]